MQTHPSRSDVSAHHVRQVTVPVMPTPVPALVLVDAVQANQLPLRVHLIRDYHNLLKGRQTVLSQCMLVKHTKLTRELDVHLRRQLLLVPEDEHL